MNRFIRMSFSSQLRNVCLQVIPLGVWTWGFQKTNHIGELVYLIITITFSWRYFQNASVPLMVFMKTYLWSEAMRELYCLFKSLLCRLAVTFSSVWAYKESIICTWCISAFLIQQFLIELLYSTYFEFSFSLVLQSAKEW